MALTIADVGVGEVGHVRIPSSNNTRIAAKKVTFDSSYATGGEAIAASDFGLTVLYAVICSPSAGYVFEWVASTGKLKAYRQKDPAAAGGADIALPEVGNTVDLSAVFTYAVAFGQ